MKLSYEGIRDRQPWLDAGIALPGYDWREMAERTLAHPVWLHFGAGNIFRGFIAGLQQKLLNQGLADRGILAAESFDTEIIDAIYDPHDAMTLMVTLKADGSTDKEVIAAIARGLRARQSDEADWAVLGKSFRDPSLQMVSFTITEKGYALRDMKGELIPAARADMEEGPARPRHAMGVVAALMLERFLDGRHPIALVSMDNCSHNGEKLRAAVLEMASAWVSRGLAPKGFSDYLGDEGTVSFPWTMIDKITPRPAPEIEQELTRLGIEEMAPVVTGKRTFIAPFVNAEGPQYLVVEDRFPAGRPALEKAGVYMTDRDTVNRTERMKVTTCLNPLHTALAVYGCLLGYEKIADEMRDEDLVRLVRLIGYREGLPVVTDPGIISPRASIDEVVTERLPNAFLPDTPQRIATDTSQKVPVRFGETLKSYAASPDLAPAQLTGIPLALAGWLRYLLGVDDQGREMPVSADPMLPQLQAELNGIRLGDPASAEGKLDGILDNPVLFGVRLSDIDLKDKVSALFAEMLEGPGAVRNTLRRHLG